MTQFIRTPNRRDGRETLARLTVSARKLLETRSFDKLKLADVTAASNVTVGAFYARFKNKQFLLEHLYQEVIDDIGSQLNTLLLEAESPQCDFQTLSWLLFSGMARVYSQHFAVLRAVSIHAQQHVHLAKEKQKGNEVLFKRGLKAMLRYSAEIPHPEPEKALRLGITFVLATLRESYVLKEFSPLSNSEQKTLAKELQIAFLLYLGFSTASS